jgi:hypothetical protein
MSDTHPDGDLQDLVAAALAAHDEGGDAAVTDYLDQLGPRAREVRGVLARFFHAGLLARPSQPQAMPEQLGEFKLRRRLGAGGMGLVFLAEQVSLRREVALKIVRPEYLLFEGARERFRREVDAIAGLRHPGIVPILAVGEDHGIPYYVMELIEGRSGEDVVAAVAGRDPATLAGVDLWHLVRRDAPHAPAEPPAAFAGAWWQACARLCAQLAQTMRHVHLRGILHRDLKPSNAMLTPHGHALVLDFGLAHVAADARITRTGTELGSPAYMSPEQVRGEPLDERTDVYSLGATLFQLLCLRPPFVAQDAHELRTRILAGPPPRPRSHNASLPRDFETVCLKALDPDRQRRYPSMAAFAADLDAVVDGRPVLARPLGLLQRGARWARRHRAYAVALGAASLFLTLVPLLLLWQQHTATQKISAEFDRAQRNLAVSKAAVETMLVRLGDEQLASTPGAEQLRVQLLEDAVALYQRLLADQSADPRLRLDRARTMEQLGKMLVDLGRHQEAERLLHEAIAVAGGDARDVDVETLALRTRVHQAVAAARSQRGAWDEAIAALQRKRTDLEEWRRREPDSTRVRLSMGTVLASMGDCERRRGRDGDATAKTREDLHRQAQTHFAAVLAAEPQHPHAPRLLASSLQELALALGDQDRHAEAITTLEQEIALVEPLVDAGNVRPRRAELLMLAHATKGLTYVDQGDRDAAAAAQRESVRYAEQLARDFPHTAMYASRLGTMLGNLADTERSLGRAAAAVPVLERAIAQQRAALALSPDLVDAKQHIALHWRALAVAQRELGERSACAAAAEELARAATRPRDTIEAATLLAEASALGDASGASSAASAALCARALALLLQVERDGWPKNIKLDGTRLAPLQGLSEFAALVARLPQ